MSVGKISYNVAALSWWGIRNLSIFGFAENLMRNGNSTKLQLAQNGGWQM
jgi:hypothetical protein